MGSSLLVVRIGIGTEVSLNQISRLVGCEAEQHVDAINVTRVETNWVTNLSWGVAELKEVVGRLGRTGHFAGSLESENEDVENETVVLEDETGELESSNHSESVDVGHVLVSENDVVLARAVIREIVIHDETEKSIEEGEIDLFVDLAELRLDKNVGLSFTRLPDVVQVVDSLRPFVDEEGRRLGVGRFDPGREKSSLVGLEVKELVEVGVRDLLHRLDIVARDQFLVGVEELDSRFLKGSLSQQESFDPRKRFMRVVVRLFDERELFTLRLVESSLDRVGLLKLFESENEELRVVLVRKRGEGDRVELARFEPVNGRGVDRYSFFGRNVRLRRGKTKVSLSNV